MPSTASILFLMWFIMQGYPHHIKVLSQNFPLEIEPKSYGEAIVNSRWVNAIQTEITALQNNKTWELITLSKGKKAIGCRWVYKIKYKADGTIDKFKARLVAKGYNQ